MSWQILIHHLHFSNSTTLSYPHVSLAPYAFNYTVNCEVVPFISFRFFLQILGPNPELAFAERNASSPPINPISASHSLLCALPCTECKLLGAGKCPLRFPVVPQQMNGAIPILIIINDGFFSHCLSCAASSPPPGFFSSPRQDPPEEVSISPEPIWPDRCPHLWAVKAKRNQRREAAD